MSTFREDIISPCEKELMSDQLKCTRTRLHQWSHSELCPMSLTPTTVMIIVGDTWILARSWPTRSASTTHALVDVLQHSNKALDEGKSGAADAEVIDHVDHNILLKKLRNNDVPKFIINWLVSILRERQQRFKTADVLSDWVGEYHGTHGLVNYLPHPDWWSSASVTYSQTCWWYCSLWNCE